MNKAQYVKGWFGFSLIMALAISLMAPFPGAALTHKQLQIKSQLEEDIKKLTIQRGILVKRMQEYHKMRIKWKKDLDIWKSRYNNLIKNKSRYVQEHGEAHYQEQMVRAFNYMRHCQDRYNNINGIIFELGRQITDIDHQLAIKNGQLAELTSESEISGSTSVKKKGKTEADKAKRPSLFGKEY